MRDRIARFAEIVRRPATGVDLGRAALAFAAVADPALDEGGALGALDALAVGVDGFAGLRRRLFGEAGFAGDAQGYHRAENSLLHRVLARRRGIPISLSVVMIEVGRRAGVPVQGIGAPGHFLVRDPASGRLCDPFDRGALIDERSAGGAGLGGGALPVADAHQILTRMLANLANSYRREGRVADVEWVLRCQQRIPGAEVLAAEQLGELLAGRGRFTAAAEELEAAAEQVGGDAREPLVAAAQKLRARLN